MDFLLELRKLENKTKKSKNNRATALISQISTFKTKPNSNFCFSKVEGFNVPRLFLKLIV